MKVYFMASPRGKTKLSDEFDKIYHAIEKQGHENVSDFLVTVDVDKFYLSDISDFFKQTVVNLKQADVCVFETTIPSLAVGHLMSLALTLSKPIVALYTGDRVPFFLSGSEDERVFIAQYSQESINKVLEDAFDFAKNQSDTRFNFFISPRHVNYLDWIAKSRKLPRSVYLRRLIESDMANNQDFKNEV